MKCNTKYKDIKIEKIPEEWTVYEISDVAEVIGGGTPSTKVPEYWGGDISWITPKDLANFEFRYIKKGVRNITKKGLDDSSAKILPKNTVLLTTRAPVGYLAIADNEITTNQGFRSLVPKRRTKSEFLFYLLKNNIAVLKANATGTTFGELSGSVLKSLKFTFPPVEEQEAITKILSDLDSKIELNNQINKNLEQIAQAIFKYWFADFEFPNENSEPYKSSGGEMVDSEMGLIPKGWNVRSLNQIANFLNGLAMQKYRPENGENYLPVLKIKELKIGKTSKNSDKCSINIDPKHIVDDGEVVFSWSGSLEVKLWCGNKAGVNQHLFKVTSANYPKWFYYYWIKHHIEDFRRIAEDKTTTMGHIKREHLSKAKVYDPGKNFFKKFDGVVNGLIELYIKNEKETKYLFQIRDILLPKLMSGEIQVPINSKVLISKNN